MKHKVMDMPKSTKLALGIVVVVVLVALIVKGAMHKKTPITEVPPLPQEEVTATPKPPRKNTPVVPVPVAPVDSRSYAELILAYKGKTLQFGASCQMPISSYVYKTDTEVLLDNRTSAPVAIKLAGMSYELPAYGYKVVTLSSEGKFMVSCGDNQNVATVTVQK